MAWFLGVVTNYYATATSLTAKATHGNQSISCIAWRIWPFPARPKGACHCTFFLLNSWPNPFFFFSMESTTFCFCRDKTARFAKKKIHTFRGQTLRNARWQVGPDGAGPSIDSKVYYSLRPKINTIVGSNTQTNTRCKITKIFFIFCGE